MSCYDEIFSTEETRAAENQERVQEIPLSELRPFKDHPFRVTDDADMEKTVESVKQYGVLTPAIARPHPDGGSDDDPGMPVTVENHVLVNHAGSVITAKPLDLTEKGWLRLTEEEGLNFVGGEITAYRFANERYAAAVQGASAGVVRA